MSKLRKSILLVLAVSMAVAVPAVTYAYSQNRAVFSNVLDRAEQTSERASERAGRVDKSSQEPEFIKRRTCRRHHKDLQQAISRLSDNSTALLGSTDTAFERIVEFYHNEQLNISNYDDYLHDINLARTDARMAVMEVSAFEFELDCDNSEAGQQLDAFRQSVNQAGTSLKNYRLKLIGLVTAMRTANTTSSDLDGS